MIDNWWCYSSMKNPSTQPVRMDDTGFWALLKCFRLCMNKQMNLWNLCRNDLSHMAYPKFAPIIGLHISKNCFGDVPVRIFQRNTAVLFSPSAMIPMDFHSEGWFHQVWRSLTPTPWGLLSGTIPCGARRARIKRKQLGYLRVTKKLSFFCTWNDASASDSGI